VNKAQLVEALSTRLGEDKKRVATTVDAFLDTVYRTVQKGEKVALTGFGVFEKRERAARTARNPRTGETVKVKKTSAPAFRPGTGFKELVASGKVAKVAPAQKTTAAKAVTAKATSAKATATRTAPAKTTAKTAPAKAAKTTAARPAATRPATKAVAKKAPAKKAR